MVSNPFTAPACKISGLKVHGHSCKQTIFWLYITSAFNALRFQENPSTSQRKNKTKKKEKKG